MERLWMEKERVGLVLIWILLLVSSIEYGVKKILANKWVLIFSREGIL